ncbi:MAG: dihydroorotate dehydrogenase-like protein [Chthoniobacterales bacterium]
MNLKTTYLGIRLRTPLVPSASPLSDTVDDVRKMEDAGAAAVVLHSIFQEQITADRYALHHHLTHGTESFAESLTYFPEPHEIKVGPESYLQLIESAKATVEIPIIASLNGTTLGGWTDYARQIEQAGADALELNIYSIPTDLERTAAAIEDSYLEIVSAVRGVVRIPVAVKLSPYFTNVANMAKRLVEKGANGLVLFNRFYQPDIDLENLTVTPNLLLSTPMAMRLPLRWLAILHGRLKASLAATSGIHTGFDALKMLMAGADVTMLCSVLLRHGIDHIKTIESTMSGWMSEHEYESVAQLKGSVSQQNSPDPSAFERVQYIHALSTYSQTHPKRW